MGKKNVAFTACFCIIKCIFKYMDVWAAFYESPSYGIINCDTVYPILIFLPVDF